MAGDGVEYAAAGSTDLYDEEHLTFMADLNTVNFANGAATVHTSEGLLDPELHRVVPTPTFMTVPNRLQIAKMFLLETNNIQHIIKTWKVDDAGDEYNFPIAAAIEDLRLDVALVYTKLEAVLKNPTETFNHEEIEETVKCCLDQYHKLEPYVDNMMDDANNPKARTLRRAPSDPVPGHPNNPAGPCRRIRQRVTVAKAKSNNSRTKPIVVPSESEIEVEPNP